MKNDLPSYIRQLRLATKKSYAEFASAARMNLDVYSDLETGLAVPNLVDFILIVQAAKASESERNFAWNMLIGHYRNEHGNEISYDGRGHVIDLAKIDPWTDSITAARYKNLAEHQAVIDGTTHQCPNGHRMAPTEKVIERLVKLSGDLPPGYVLKDVEIEDVWDQLPASVKQLHLAVGKHADVKIKTLERRSNYDCGATHGETHAGAQDKVAPPVVTATLDRLPDGFYVASGPAGELMLVSLKGKVYQMKLDSQLNDEGWQPGHVLRGPIQVNDPTCPLGHIDVLGNGRFRVRPTGEAPTPPPTPSALRGLGERIRSGEKGTASPITPKVFRSMRDILSGNRAGMTEAGLLNAILSAGDESECTLQEKMEFVNFMEHGGPRTPGVDKAIDEIERDVLRIFGDSGLIAKDKVPSVMEDAIAKIREAESKFTGAGIGALGAGIGALGGGSGVGGFTDFLRGLAKEGRDKEAVKQAIRDRTKAKVRHWLSLDELKVPGLYMVKDPSGTPSAQRVDKTPTGRWRFVVGKIRGSHSPEDCTFWGPIPE